MKKIIYTLNLNGYPKEITNLTYPLIKLYADKIGAEFFIINKRQYPDMPVTYEKLQIYELGKNNDWNIFIDSDAIVHPDLFDITEVIGKDTVFQNGTDMVGNRFRYDNYLRRDGRNIGACNWFTIGSNWCIDLWHPLEDLTLEEALNNIFPANIELISVITKDHLIDDYVLSRNIARYGLKYINMDDLLGKLGRQKDEYLYHQYIRTTKEKIDDLNRVIKNWKLERLIQ